MPISAWKPCQRGAIRSKPLIVSYRGRAFAPRSRRWCSHRTSAGRKPFDAMLMFRMLVLQALNNLSDEQLEYQVRDRLSFQAPGRSQRRRPAPWSGHECGRAPLPNGERTLLRPGHETWSARSCAWRAYRGQVTRSRVRPACSRGRAHSRRPAAPSVAGLHRGVVTNAAALRSQHGERTEARSRGHECGRPAP